MSIRKGIILSILFVTSYVTLFFGKDGAITSIILATFFLILIFIPWEGNIFMFIKGISEKIKDNKIKHKPNFKPDANSKIAVALSGGVDSAVVAHLLIEEGYEVEAFFMRNWDSTANLELNNILTEDEICQQEEDYNDAKKIAKHLGIKLHRVDFVKEYWDDVFSVFLRQINEGLTPNPDILCNRHIKFERFLNYIENDTKSKFDYVATGHYAKIIEDKGYKFLGQAKDSFKDQTYFLSEILKEKLNKIIFPLANLTKDEVREIAIEAKIPVADKKDSTGICFIGKRNFPEFISNYLKENPGKIVDEETGDVVGEHRGALFYTIGQRKGLNLGGYDKPYFVSNKDIKNNIIFVSLGKDNSKLFTNTIYAKNFNFLIDETLLKDETKVKFKTRHSEIIYSGKYTQTSEDEVKIVSKEKVKAVTPGQELVIYLNGICIGGGQIFNKKD